MPILTTDITSSNWGISADNYGEIVTDLGDIAQCISILLSTDVGSVAFKPTFGFNMAELIDKPVNFVIPRGKIGILDAINAFETRVTVDRIEHTLDVSHVTFVVYCSTFLGNFVVDVSTDPLISVEVYNFVLTSNGNTQPWANTSGNTFISG